MANLYLSESLGDEAFIRGELVEVGGEEARHAVRVSRLRVGERIAVGNGAGILGEGVVESAGKDRFAVRIDTVRFDPAPDRSLVLVQALAKGDRDERAVEQATEFGVDAIVPWQAERSVSRWDRGGPEDSTGGKTAKGLSKWARIAREASKQSLRGRVPEVREPMTLDGLRALAAGGEAHVVVLHPRGADALSGWASRCLAGETAPREDVYLVVGPEGGLSNREVSELQGAGAQVLSLGSTVLRTSSAGPAALAVLNVALGRW